jgi:NUDIX domain
VPTQRYASIIDLHVILPPGGKILRLRRSGDTYAAGQLCLPSGHLEQGESIAQACVVDPARLPPNVVGAAVERGLTFTLNGW